MQMPSWRRRRAAIEHTQQRARRRVGERGYLRVRRGCGRLRDEATQAAQRQRAAHATRQVSVAHAAGLCCTLNVACGTLAADRRAGNHLRLRL